MTCVNLYPFIWVIGNTDQIQHNKKLISTFKVNLEVIFLEEICFPSAISVFSECFQIKYFRNLSGSKYHTIWLWWHLIRVLIRLRSRPPQILAGIWLYFCHIRKWWVLNKWITFFGAKSRCFLSRSHSPAKAMQYADETLSFHDSAKRATQWSYILIKYQDWVYTHFHFKSFDVAYLQLRVELHLN